MSFTHIFIDGKTLCGNQNCGHTYLPQYASCPRCKKIYKKEKNIRKLFSKKLKIKQM